MRAGVLVFVVKNIVPPPPHVVVGPPQTVQTEHPIVCVHTRLIDEVEEWKIQRSLQMVREMGATTIVEFFPWAYIEPVQGEYWWGQADMIINHATAQGLRVIARLGMAPEWARPELEEGETTLTHLEPVAFDDFAHFVELFTTRYRGQVDHIIIWNEPNLIREWGYVDVMPGPERYVELLRATTPAARRGNPDVVVLAGALAPTLEPVGSSFGINDLDYLEGMYEAGAADYFDALAIHTYGFRFPPDDPPAPDVMNFRRAELLRDVMVRNGDADTPVYITESGWNDHPRWNKAVRPGQRITYTIDAFRYAEENWPWAENLCVWALRYPIPTYSYFDYFTLVAPDFTPKPIYQAIQDYARGWDEETP